MLIVKSAEKKREIKNEGIEERKRSKSGGGREIWRRMVIEDVIQTGAVRRLETRIMTGKRKAIEQKIKSGKSKKTGTGKRIMAETDLKRQMRETKGRRKIERKKSRQLKRRIGQETEVGVIVDRRMGVLKGAKVWRRMLLIMLKIINLLRSLISLMTRMTPKFSSANRMLMQSLLLQYLLNLQTWKNAFQKCEKED